MKKFLALLLALTTTLSLVACGGNAEEKTEAEVKTETEEVKEEVKTEAETEEVKEETEAETTLPEEPLWDVDKNLFDVEVTIPASYADEGTTQESLNAIVTEKGYKSVTLNPDGSVTYVMTKNQHKDLMEEMKVSINESLAEMVASETYPTYVEIKANDDYTSFDVIMSTDTVGLTEAFSVLAFYVYGGLYNSFNGKEVDNISVSFINQATGAVIHTANSKDME